MTTTAVKTGLAEQADAHMQTIHPEATAVGGWTVARDNRDGSAVVVWRTGLEPVQPGVRGGVLYRWLVSLRGAGFTGVARTDMEVFGRPGEESPDGFARWLHVTGWSEPGTAASTVLPPLPPVPPQVIVPMPRGRRLVCPLSGVPVTELVFTYRPGRPVEIVLHYEQGDWDFAGLEPQPPKWLAELAEQHRPGVAS